MTIQEQINFIREKCIAANPEIATEYPSPAQKEEARDFLRENPQRDDFVMSHMERFMNAQGEADDTSISLANEWDEMESIQRAKVQILYRPIRLADVLLAIGETDWYVGRHGRFFKWSRNLGEMIGQPISWNLRADDLEKQSPETINFLAD